GRNVQESGHVRHELAPWPSRTAAAIVPVDSDSAKHANQVLNTTRLSAVSASAPQPPLRTCVSLKGCDKFLHRSSERGCADASCSDRLDSDDSNRLLFLC